MPVSADTIGATARPLRTRLDAASLMAYAAGVPDSSPELYDTTASLRVHPLYPVSPEWQLLISNNDILAPDITPDEARRGVHAEHALEIHRPLQPGVDVTIIGQVVGVDARRAGAARFIRFIATDDQDQPVWTTTLGSVWRGVSLEGGPAGVRHAVATSAPSPAQVLDEIRIDVGATDALVYSACAGIWNPIHTDLAIARSAGLATPILHGTATLARAVSAVAAWRRAPVWSVTRIAARFGAMVPNGSSITVRVLAADDDVIRFDVRNQDREPAIRDGLVALR